MTTEFFTLKEDGVIVWIENMPEENLTTSQIIVGVSQYYQKRLQSAISNAIKVRNQGEVKFALHSAHADSKGEWVYNYNTPYPLQCHVEKKQHCETNGDACPIYDSILHKTVALVTFSEPEKKDILSVKLEVWFEKYTNELRRLGWTGPIDEDKTVDPYDDGVPPEDAARLFYQDNEPSVGVELEKESQEELWQEVSNNYINWMEPSFDTHGLMNDFTITRNKHD